MMLAFDNALADQLNNSTSKRDWANKLKAALGSSRRVRCYKDANAGAINPYTSGTEFLNVGASGELVIASGAIIGLGTLSNVTVKVPTDLSTGTCALRIEGNGHWVQGSLGLAGASTDFIFTSNMTATAGVAFQKKFQDQAFGIAAPKTLPSGIGPAAPTLDIDAPYYVVIEDWTVDPPVVAGELIFNDPKENLLFESEEITAEMGDVRVTQSTQSITLKGLFEFGATMFSMNSAINSEENRPLHQVLIACKPTSTNWPNYPSYNGYKPKGTYGAASTTTFPTAFKAIIKKQNGEILHTHELRDGLPINSPQQSPFRTDTVALRPHFTCAMMLPWQSHKPKLATRAKKYLPNINPNIVRPSVMKLHTSVNAPIPLVGTLSTNLNANAHYLAMPKWPQPCGPNGKIEDNVQNDKYLYDVDVYSTHVTSQYDYNSARIQGWGYEPGSISGHDWYTGPGGPRFDRAGIPSALANYWLNPTGTYLKDGSSYEERLDHWNLAYFNHSCHYMKDVKSMSALPYQQILDGAWSFGSAYYGQNDTGYGLAGKVAAVIEGRDYSILSAGDYTVPLFAIGQSGAGAGGGGEPYFAQARTDYSGRLIWNGWALDKLHDYAQPGWVALTMNSPMHFVAQCFRARANAMAQLAVATPYSYDSTTNKYTKPATSDDVFLHRGMAWRWLNWAMNWVLAIKHTQFGMPRALTERRFEQDLEAIYQNWYKPCNDPSNDQYLKPRFKSLRAYGQPVSDNESGSSYITKQVPDSSGNWYYTIRANGMAYYVAIALLLMKRSGLWDVMLNKSDVCRKTLLWVIHCLDKGSVDFILDTDGRDDLTYTRISHVNPASIDQLPEPISWADWSANIRPKVGQENWLKNSDGTWKENNVSERGKCDVAAHFRPQYLSIRKHFFPEIEYPRLDEALAKYEAYYQEVEDAVNAVEGPIVDYKSAAVISKKLIDWTNRYPAMGLFLATELEE
jgi:hypothetical protein